MEKTIFLHIGMTKTGTTAIQYFCNQNKDRLFEDGVIFRLMPWHYKDTNIRRNGLFLRNTDISKKKISSNEELVKQHFEAYEILKGWLDEGDSVVLTDEGLWNHMWICGYELLKELKDFAEKNGAVLKVIVYLRRQDSWINSIYQQRIKKNIEANEWDQFLDSKYVKQICLEYDKNLENLEEILGTENVIVRKYKPKRFEQGCIEYNFLDAIGIRDFEGYKIKEKKYNPSPLMNHIEIKRILNEITPLCAEKLNFDAELFWRDRLKELSYINGQTRAENAIPDEYAEIIMSDVRESNNKVAEKFFGPGTTLFKDGSSGRTVWNKNNENRYEDTIKFLGYIILKQQDEIVQNSEKIKLLESDLKAMRKDLNKQKKSRNPLKKIIGK